MNTTESTTMEGFAWVEWLVFAMDVYNPFAWCGHFERARWESISRTF